MLAGSKTDLLLGMAGLISNNGRDWDNTVRKGGEILHNCSQTEEWGCVRNNPADTQVSTEAGRGAAPGTRTDSPAAHGEVPLRSMEVHKGAEIHLQSMEDPTTEQVGAWKRLWPCGKPMLFLCFHSSVQISNRKALIGSCCPATDNLRISMLEWSKAAVFCFSGELGRIQTAVLSVWLTGEFGCTGSTSANPGCCVRRRTQGARECVWGGGPGFFWHPYTALNSMRNSLLSESANHITSCCSFVVHLVSSSLRHSVPYDIKII